MLFFDNRQLIVSNGTALLKRFGILALALRQELLARVLEIKTVEQALLEKGLRPPAGRLAKPPEAKYFIGGRHDYC